MHTLHLITATIKCFGNNNYTHFIQKINIDGPTFRRMYTHICLVEVTQIFGIIIRIQQVPNCKHYKAKVSLNHSVVVHYNQSI